MKKIITETELRQIVNESVKNVLNKKIKERISINSINENLDFHIDSCNLYNTLKSVCENIEYTMKGYINPYNPEFIELLTHDEVWELFEKTVEFSEFLSSIIMRHKNK